MRKERISTREKSWRTQVLRHEEPDSRSSRSSLKPRRPLAALFSLLLAVLVGSGVALAAEGDFDTSFGDAGVRQVAFGLEDELAHGVALDAAGRIVMVGEAETSGSARMGTARLTSGGGLDSTFSGDGRDLQNPGLGADQAFDVAVSSTLKIVVAGCTVLDVERRWALLRYFSSGSLDGSFSGDGLVTDGPAGSCALGVAIQEDDKVVLAGYSADRTRLALARYGTGGVLDSGFGAGGTVILDRGLGSEQLYDVAIQPDGRILAAGCVITDTISNMVLLRLESDGTLDSGFGSGGVATVNISGQDDCLHALELLPDGRIAVAGTSAGGAAALVGRFTASGSPDATFGGNGFALADVGLGDDAAWDVAAQKDGKLVVVGGTVFDSVEEHLLMRYRADGVLDTSFAGDGIVHLPILGTESGARAVALQEDGEIVVAGYVTDELGTLGAVARFIGPGVIFADGFESGSTGAWSSTVP